MIPTNAAATLKKAKAVWDESIDKFGRDVVLSSVDGQTTRTVKGFCKRPKILGLFDRTEQSYDQEKYLVMTKADAFDSNFPVEKFVRATFDGEDHSIINATQVDLFGQVFGYRILVKG